ncbi:MAG TPA: esterase-like activity of phytase family protein [Bdellovibrionota bacterium]|nr:esterase-like activity of phytase family protein [Bdellovibrionota bacterium]
MNPKALLPAALAILSCLTAQAGELSFKFLGDWNLPTATEKSGAPIGGLSGIVYDPARKELLALSDNKGDRGDVRFHRFRLILEPGKFLLRHLGHTPLRAAGGAKFPPKKLDPEGIALLGKDRLFVSSEGLQRGRKKPKTMPEIIEFSRDGRFVRALPVPRKFLPPVLGTASYGVGRNGGFEGLTLTPDGKYLFAATERPLQQDDAAPTLETGVNIRILRYALEGAAAKPDREYAYRIDPLFKPEGSTTFAALGNGVSELLALDESRLLVLERATSASEAGILPRIRIYLATITPESADISGVESLLEKPAKPLDKKLVLDLESVRPSLDEKWRTLDNFEAMAFGPTLADGSPSLILVSDNNFRPEQRTQALAFEILGLQPSK